MSTRNFPNPEDVDVVEWHRQERELDNIDPRSIETYEREVRQFQGYLKERHELELHEATERHAKKYRAHLRDETELSEKRVGTVLDYLSAFYNYLSERDIFEMNIFSAVRGFDTSQPIHRPEIGLNELRRHIAGVKHPLRRALIVTFLKTGVRNGEVTNIDCRDVHLDHSRVNAEYDIAPRPEIESKPDSLYVASKQDMRNLDIEDREERPESNKRKTATIFPVDQDLKRALVAWLDIRPDTESSAFFTNTSGGDDNWGTRLNRHLVNHEVRKEMKAQGWHEGGHDSSTNVTPHYFRHYFTTHMRHRVNDTVLKYLRGDSLDSNMLDKYTQHWGFEIREAYLNNIYDLQW